MTERRRSPMIPDHPWHRHAAPSFKMQRHLRTSPSRRAPRRATRRNTAQQATGRFCKSDPTRDRAEPVAAARVAADSLRNGRNGRTQKPLATELARRSGGIDPPPSPRAWTKRTGAAPPGAPPPAETCRRVAIGRWIAGAPWQVTGRRGARRGAVAGGGAPDTRQLAPRRAVRKM